MKWTTKDADSGVQYKVIYRQLTAFDDNWKQRNQSRMEDRPEVVIVQGNSTDKLLGPLKPNTMYEIKMIAFNKFGESLPTNLLRVVTHGQSMVSPAAAADDDGTAVDKSNNTTIGQDESMKVPNLRQCCTNKGVRNDACLKQLCEPFVIEPVEVEESIMCMKYMNTSYKCIDEIRDHVDYE